MESELGARIKSFSLINWPGLIISTMTGTGVLLLILVTQSDLLCFAYVVVPLCLILALRSMRWISVVVYGGGLFVRTLLSSRVFLWKDILDVRFELENPKQQSARGLVALFALLFAWLIGLGALIAAFVQSYSVSRYTLVLRDGSKVKIVGNRSPAALEREISKYLAPSSRADVTTLNSRADAGTPSSLVDETLTRLEAGEKIQLHSTVSYSKDGIEGTKKLGRRRGAVQKSFSISWHDFTGVITEDGWVSITANDKTMVSLPQGEISNLKVFTSIVQKVLNEGLFDA